jgi:osmotically-inducible protein OsmY
MITRSLIAIALISTSLVLGACDGKSDQTSATRNPASANPPAAGTAADNTARNKADRDAATKTPMDQSNSTADIKITADIRSAIMGDKSMSMNAQNCKIITDKSGVVTLRGPVASQAEKDSIESKAKAVAGVNSIVNELEVKQN